MRSVTQLYNRLNPQSGGAAAAAPATRVKGQFHVANANVNLGWEELRGKQDSDALTQKTWRDPLLAHDQTIGAGQPN